MTFVLLWSYWLFRILFLVLFFKDSNYDIISEFEIIIIKYFPIVSYSQWSSLSECFSPRLMDPYISRHCSLSFLSFFYSDYLRGWVRTLVFITDSIRSNFLSENFTVFICWFCEPYRQNSAVSQTQLFPIISSIFLFCSFFSVCVTILVDCRLRVTYFAEWLSCRVYIQVLCTVSMKLICITLAIYFCCFIIDNILLLFMNLLVNMNSIQLFFIVPFFVLNMFLLPHLGIRTVSIICYKYIILYTSCHHLSLLFVLFVYCWFIQQ